MFLIVFGALLLIGCASKAVVDEEDIEPDVPEELQIVDRKTVRDELKPARLERIVPPNFDPSVGK